MPRAAGSGLASAGQRTADRHLEAQPGGGQAFGAVAKPGTGIEGPIRRSLDAVGRTDGMVVAAFADGCHGLRRSLTGAGAAAPPMLDWFRIAMRLQRLKRIANGLPADGPARTAAEAVIAEAVERPHWRIWNGKARDAQISIERIRAVMRHP